jgi:hypothetical protein
MIELGPSLFPLRLAITTALSPSTLAPGVKYLVWNLNEGGSCRLNSRDNPPDVLGGG